MRLLVIGFGVLALTGCNLGYPEMFGEWDGRCSLEDEDVSFTLFNFRDDQGAGFVNDNTVEVTGEHEVYPLNFTMEAYGHSVEGAGDRIMCLDPEGCTFAEDLVDVPEHFTRLNLAHPFDETSLRFVLDGDWSGKSYEGTCFVQLRHHLEGNDNVLAWGTFEAERTESAWVDDHKEQQ